MTLLEKFLNIKCYNTRPVDLSISQATECVKVANEFVIGFAEWLDISETAASYYRRNSMKFHPTMDGSHNIFIKDARKELLEIYKKEKGL